MTNPTKWSVRPAKIQISGCPVGSESSLSAQWIAKDPKFLHVDSEDWSDWADAKADLSLRWANRSFCWFCHEVAQILAVWIFFPSSSWPIVKGEEKSKFSVCLSNTAIRDSNFNQVKSGKKFIEIVELSSKAASSTNRYIPRNACIKTHFMQAGSEDCLKKYLFFLN